MLSLGAAGLGCPQPGPDAAGASAVWGQGSAPWGPYGPLGPSWASSTLRVKGFSGLTLSVGYLEGWVLVAGAPGPFHWQWPSQRPCPLSGPSLVPAHNARSPPGLLPLGIVLRVASATCPSVVGIQSSTTSHRNPRWPRPWGPGWGTFPPAPALFL